MRNIKKQKNGYSTRKTVEGYAFLLPFLILFFIFTILPIVVSVVLSFTYFNGLSAPVWVGLGNYIKLFLKDELFTTAFSNTMVLAVITGPISYLICLFLAWVISEFNNGLRWFLTLLFYTPSISGSAYLVFTLIFSGDQYGWMNAILMQLNIIYEPIQWTTDTAYMMPVAIVVILWTSLGTSFLSFIAGFQNMDRKLFEAAAVDGIRNRWQEFWYITLPSIRPQLMFGAVMSITASFGIGAVIDGVFGNPSTDYALYTMVHELQDYAGTRLELGYASAIATVLFAIMLLANSLIQKALQKVGG